MENSDFENYVAGEDGEPAPEEVFQAVTIMPKRKIKMTAYLQDKDGERINLATVATNLKTYIDKHLQNEDITPVNGQLFPLVNQMMISSVPRHAGFPLSMFMFAAEGTRYALATFGLASFLLAKYIQQHDLQVITEETKITEKELEDFLNKQQEANDKLFNAMGVEED